MPESGNSETMIFWFLNLCLPMYLLFLEFASSTQWIFLKSFATWVNICLYVAHWQRVSELSSRNPPSCTSSWDWFSSLQLFLDANPDIDTISVGMYSNVSKHKFQIRLFTDSARSKEVLSHLLLAVNLFQWNNARNIFVDSNISWEWWGFDVMTIVTSLMTTNQC